MGLFTSSAPSQQIPDISANHEHAPRQAAESTSKTSNSTSSPLEATPNDPAVTGYDPAAPWTNRWNILTNRMSRTGKEHFREDAYKRNEATDIARVEAWRDYLFAYSPIIRFLNQNIQDLNGDLGPQNVVCQRCPTRVVVEEFWATKDGERIQDVKEGEATEGLIKRRVEKRVRQGGGFSPDHGIMVCANEMRSQGHMEDTLAHEMVHAWDHARFKVDWGDLKHAACTEIRASMLSGECRWTREFFTRNNWKLTQQFQHCVRQRATRSVMHRPNCKDEGHASKVVNEVWDSCFADTRPFDEVYK